MSGPPELGDHPAKDFAAAICSGPVGFALFDVLTENFPSISRADAFLGISLAWTVREADVMAALMEVQQLRKAMAAAQPAEPIARAA